MRDLNHYLTLPYEETVEREDCTNGTECYVARVIELRGCLSHGETPEEALENLQDAKRLYVEKMLEAGVELPEPELAVTDGTAAADSIEVGAHGVWHQPSIRSPGKVALLRETATGHAGRYDLALVTS